MKRLILSNVNSQEVRKKSDAVIVPQEYISKFDSIFAKYKQYSFIPLLNEAIRAKDLSPQCITLKKILRAKELVEGMEEPELLQVSAEVTQWITEVLFNIDSRNIHRDLLAIIGRFMECSAIKEHVYKTFTTTAFECFNDRDDQFLLRLYGITALLAYQPMWVFFKDHTLLVMQYMTKHLTALTDIMQRGEIVNYTDIVNKAEVLLNTYLSFATKFSVADELRQELAKLAQEQNKTVFALLTGTTLTALPNHEEAPYCLIAHKVLNYLAAIMRSPICSTDCNYSAGLLVALFLRNIATGSTDDKEQIRTQIVHAILYNYANPSAVANTTSVLQFFVSNEYWIYGKEFLSFTNIGQLAVLRGTLLALDSDFDILFAPTKALKKSSVSSAEEAILLLDGLFMMTCNFCETSSERYNRFIAFQSLDSCLDQTKRFVQQGGKVSPLHVKAMINVVLDLIWKNWEDPFESIVSQVRNIFVKLMEVYDGCVAAFGSMDEHLGTDFVLNLTKQLLYLDWHCKGKYPILLTLLMRVGYEAVLNLRHDFVAHLLLAMSNNTVSKQAAGVLETFLKLIHDAATAELKNGQRFKTTEEVDAHCRSYWMAPLLESLFEPLTYGGTATYTVPVVLKEQPESLPFILDAICLAGTASTESGPVTLSLAQYRALVGVLKIARRMELFEPQQLTSMKGMKSTLSMTDLIESALIHQDRDIRLDVLELLCVTKRKSEQISEFELKSLLTFITYNLLDSSSPFRRKVFLLVEKMLVRLRDSAQKLYQTATKQKQGGVVPPEVAMSVHYTNWVSSLLNFNLYPGSCYPRLTACLELIQFLTSTFPSDKVNTITFIKNSDIPLQLYTPDNAAHMLHTVRDHYDDDRRMSDDILKRFPNPLPGFTAESLKTLIQSALDWVSNPRMHECDTACITINTVVSKFIRAGWKIRLQPDGEIVIAEHDTQTDRSLAVLDFLNDLIALVDKHVAVAKESIAKASAVAPMHGPLMAIRFILSEVDFSDKEIKANGEKWRVFLADFIQRLYTVRDVAFTVGHPVRYRLDLVNEDDESMRLNAELEGGDDNEGEEEDGELDFVEFSHGQGQAIVVCAWLCLKEVSLGLATVVKKTPLADSRTMLVSEEQIHSIGNLMLDSLLQIRHKGAIEKLSAGLQAVCEILFSCINPRVNALPIAWLNDLINRVLHHSKKMLSQRRSAGLPYAFLSILRAEVLCKKRCEAQGVVVSSDLLHDTFRTLLDVTNNKMPHLQALVDKGEFFHQVHALNIIRSVLRDSQVMFESGPLVEATLVTVLNLYGSVRWPVQNAATCTFATILGRYVAWRQARRSEEASVVKSSVNGMTPAEFFSRFPRMHKLLKEKIDSILSGGANQPNLGSKASRQTSLYAILVLLSRLLPSRMESPKDQHVEQAFLPVVRQCCTSSDMMVRTMAARALVPLVSSRDFQSFITEQLIDAIPNQDSTAPLNYNTLHGILLQIQILLRGHEPLMFFAEAKTALHEEILPRLLSKLWLVSDPRSAPAVGSVLLDIIAEFVLGVNQPHKQHYLQQTRSKCTAFKQLSEQAIELAKLVLARPTTGLSVQQLILNYNMRRLAATILIHDAFELKSGHATDLVLKLMVDPAYEVRLLIVNYVNEHLRKWKTAAKSSLLIDVNPIQALVLSRLGMEAGAKIEEHNETIVQLLKIMSDVDLDLPQQLFSSFFEENTAASDDLWSKLWTFYNSKSSLVKEEGFRAMGFYLKQLCQHLHTVGRQPLKDKLALAFSQWIELTNKHSDVDQPLEMRTIVADSLISAGLSHKTLAQVPTSVRDILEKATVESWMVVVKLLQDDDDDLRDSVAKFAASLAYEGSKLPVHNSVIVSRAIQLAFDYLTQHFSSSEHYFEYLIKLVVQSEDIATSMNRDNVEDDVLFETEEDNIFNENVSLVQFATYHLNEVLTKHSDSAALTKHKARLAELLPTAVSYLKTAVEWMKQAQAHNTKQVMWLLFDEFKFLVFYRVFMTALIVFRAHQGAVTQLPGYDAFKTSLAEFNTLRHIHPVLSFTIDNVNGLMDPSTRVTRSHDPYISLYFSTGLNLHSTQWQLTKN